MSLVIITDKQVYTVRDVQEILGLGTNRAYDLMRSSSFPSYKVNGVHVVNKEDFAKWMIEHNKENKAKELK